MSPRYSCALLPLALVLGACDPNFANDPDGADDVESRRVAAPAKPAPSTAPRSPAPIASQPAAGGEDGENDGYPDLTPTPLTNDTARAEKGARAILLTWAGGIELREFDQSWEMMGEPGRAQRTKAEFNALFHPLRNITVAVPPGTIGGAAGSLYYTVPTTITGTRADGSKATLKGEVIMRRVNDVDGATPAQLAWHIISVDLNPA